MSKLNIDQKTIRDLFSHKKADFLIPDYQRPYAWTEVECMTLWEDIFSFAFPDNDCEKFDSANDEYFLGPIVMYKDSDKSEIIDGQQRLTTLMLLLRAFYEKFGNMQDANSKTTKECIEKCIWKTDEFGNPDKSALKINSEVATDEDKEEFINILKTGIASDNKKSHYSKNYKFLQKMIDEFLHSFPSYFSYLPIRLLNNCILLPIEAESQDTALRIFSTLNDRGKPLSDADIFKAQFYKYYSGKGEKDIFITKWKDLEELCSKIFTSSSSHSMDELFTRYMHFERAKMKIKDSTTESLRKFYEKDTYYLLRQDYVFDNLIILADFWNNVHNQDATIFSERVLKKLFVLNYAPNSMWTNLVSVYFMANKDDSTVLDEEKFFNYLTIVIAFIWGYAITNPGVNALRTPVYAEMVSIIEGAPLNFRDYRFDLDSLSIGLSNFNFYNMRPITKSMLAWWAYEHNSQPLFPLTSNFQIEHIYAKKRQELEKGLNSWDTIELLGNKSLLEKPINIRAADYKFSDKCRHYKGYITAKNHKVSGTEIIELLDLSVSFSDFAEKDILRRNKKIIDMFISHISQIGLEKT